MKILVTGSNGQLGKSIKKIVHDEKYKGFSKNFVFVSRLELDLSQLKSINNYFETNSIDLIINCAAYTKVDEAESNPEEANQINHLAVKEMAKIAKKKDIRFIHISTDFVFDGNKGNAYLETDFASPINIYGKTKLDGENAILSEMKFKAVIIRTSWLFSEFGNNFVDTILNISQKNSELNIVHDQIGGPTYAFDLANAILHIASSSKFIMKRNKSQVYHYSNTGECSWFEFAQEITNYYDIKCLLKPISSEHYLLPASRPKNSSLDKKKIIRDFDLIIDNWKDSLKVCLKKLKT
jgi:dTDP-4-dehydrorhamnose reductase